MDMLEESVKDIHTRLGKIEEKQDKLITLVESMSWVKRHLWALWAAVLTLLGVHVKHGIGG